MKSMIMLLTLTFYNTATLAAQADDQNTYQQQLKHRHQNAISNVQPLPVPAFDGGYKFYIVWFFIECGYRKWLYV